MSEPVTSASTAAAAGLHEQVARCDQRLVELDKEIAEHRRDMIDKDDVAAAFGDFDNLWSALSPREQVRLVNLLVSRVEFDADESCIAVSLHPSGISALAAEAGASATASAEEDAA